MIKQRSNFKPQTSNNLTISQFNNLVSFYIFRLFSNFDKKFKMKILFIIICSLVLSQVSLIAQNVGQQGDSLVNYIDINGNKQGFWQKKYDNGKLKYEGYFKNNYIVGVFKRYYEVGTIKAIMNYEKKGTLARTKIFYETGELFAEGNYLNEKRDSIWNFYTTTKVLIYKQSYKSGNLDGISCKYFGNGNKSEEMYYKDNLLDGPWIQYFDDGSKKLESANVKNQRTGKLYVYYPSGSIEIMGYYEKGLKEKHWKWLNEDGSIEKERDFVKDRATNQDEIDTEFSKKLKEMEEGKDKFVEPEKEFMEKMMQGGF